MELELAEMRRQLAENNLKLTEAQLEPAETQLEHLKAENERLRQENETCSAVDGRRTLSPSSDPDHSPEAQPRLDTHSLCDSRPARSHAFDRPRRP